MEHLVVLLCFAKTWQIEEQQHLRDVPSLLRTAWLDLVNSGVRGQGKPSATEVTRPCSFLL